MSSTRPTSQAAHTTDLDVTTEALPAAGTVPDHAPDVAHRIRVVDGRFMIARCSCGWHSSGRRLRSAVREEARDHALLYAGAELTGDLRDDR